MLLLAYLPLFIYFYFPTPVYLAILLALINTADKKRTVESKVHVALFIIIPAAFWLYAYLENRHSVESYQKMIEDIPKAALPAVLPNMLLIYEGDIQSIRMYDLASLGCGATKKQQDTFDHRAKPVQRKSIKDILPSDRYFIFDLRYPNPLSGSLTNRAAGQGPFELDFVEDGKKQLIAFHYAPFLPTPYPILASFGWYRPSNSVSDTTKSRNAIDFLRESIGQCIDLEIYMVDSHGDFYWSNIPN